MYRNAILIGLGTIVFTLLGLTLFQLQGQVDSPTMNYWGVVSFASLGTSIGFLAVEPSSTCNFFDWWS